ncbi:hypothetical protein LC607_07255 [Nostoc sp. CHAB 5824]|nr:hypothetical protein [Nostoc sp. CHAB 5824]
MLVLNIFPPSHKNDAVEVVYLNALSKTQLLGYWEDTVKNPDRYRVYDVEPVKNPDWDIPARDLLTLGQYLDEKNIIVDEAEYHKLAIRVAEKYREVYGINPRKVSRTNDSGKWNNKSYAYSKGSFSIIEGCLLTVRHTRLPK